LYKYLLLPYRRARKITIALEELVFFMSHEVDANDDAIGTVLANTPLVKLQLLHIGHWR
jgi:hypothetical protein